jgi:hypothetical protein
VSRTVLVTNPPNIFRSYVFQDLACLGRQLAKNHEVTSILLPLRVPGRRIQGDKFKVYRLRIYARIGELDRLHVRANEQAPFDIHVVRLTRE